MKRLGLALLVLALSFALVGGAWAKGAKVPKSVCMYMYDWGDELAFTFKSMGSTTINGAAVTVYSISGWEIWVDPDPSQSYQYPISGTGYLSGTTLIFNWSATNYRSTRGGRIDTIWASWNLTQTQADAFYFVIYPDGSYESSTDVIGTKNCADLHNPY